MPSKRRTTKPKAVNNEQVQKEVKAQLTQLIGGRSGFLSRLAGIQYAGNRDIFRTAGYIAPGKVIFEHYWGLYTRGDIAGRLVDMPAKTTWRTPPEIVELDGDGDAIIAEDSAFVSGFNTLAKRLRLWSMCSRVDRLCGVGRYAVLFIGVKNTNENQLKEPLQKASLDDIVYLSVYHEKNASIEQWENDPGNPRFGHPKTYRLKVSSDQATARTGSTAASDLVVHASRCIHVAEDLLEDEVFGRPRLERVLNRLYDLEKVAASTGESYWQTVVRILQAKIDPTAEISTTQMADLDTKLTEMVHDLRRQFYGRGVELSWLNTTTPDPSQVSDFYFSLIAGASGIPKRILFGNEQGHLASTTDESNWLGMINERQETFAEPAILRAFIDRMIGITALPTPKSKEYAVVWPTLYEETDGEKADANLKRAQTAAALAGPGGNPLALVEVDEENGITLVPRKPTDPVPEQDMPPLPGDGTDGTDEIPEVGEPEPDGAGGLVTAPLEGDGAGEGGGVGRD